MLIITFVCLVSSATGVLASDAKGRDIRIDSYSLSFHGRVLVENADVTLKCVRLRNAESRVSER